ncbi:rubrerythrin-like domain-containing protein [Halomarina salina]|uniref:Rubrerythrin-like domain-containing protein n=1 Tax=Halomarina salina TaxID=1872699 RepID=A0ABD5RJ25_9EURY|nr:rubrerythrin-like domain-containing protein [Halomarina salina]
MSRDSDSEMDAPPYIYECVDCGEREEADQQPVACSECGGEMRNLSRPSEQ